MAVEQHFSLTRRNALGLGLTGLLAVTTGCGVRLDRDPAIPELSTTDSVRNQVARILAQTQAQTDDSATLEAFVNAIGPQWAPPPELATASPAAEPERSLPKAASEIITTVLDSFADLDGPTAAVLCDVATGCAGVLKYPAEVRTRFATPLPASVSATQSPVAEDNPQPAGDTADIPAHPFVSYAQKVMQASYGYERLAVHIDHASQYGGFVRNRVEELALHGESVLSVLSSLHGQTLPADQPAWELAIKPVDEDSAHKLAIALEDSLIPDLANFFTQFNSEDFAGYSDRSQLLAARALVVTGLENSAYARTQAGAAQPLRFTTAQASQED